MKPIFLFALLFLIYSCKIEKDFPHSLGPGEITKLDSLGNRYLELNRFSGVILLAREDSIIYNESFGFADYDNNKAFSDKTAFKIGKLSELITEAIVRKMAEQGKFVLSDKVSQFIPEVNSEFTINDLLAHKTVLPDIETLKEDYPDIEYNTIKFFQLAVKSPEKSESSDLEYNLLGMIIERVSGLSYQENIENYAYEKGLENTYFEKSGAEVAVGYLYGNFRGNGMELEKSSIADPDLNFSSSGIKSTPKDLLKIINSVQDKNLNISGYLKEDGFSYSISQDSKSKITIVILSNRRHPVAGEISNSIVAILNGEDYGLPLKREAVKINTKLLEEYSGIYKLNGDMNLEVLNENDSLYVIMGPKKVPLIPQSANQFYMEEGDAALRFLRDETQVVNYVELLDGFLEGNKIPRVR